MAYNPILPGGQLRNAIEALQGPPKSVGILLRFLDQDDDFCTAVTTAFRNSATFNSVSDHSPLDATLLSEDELYTRAHSVLLLAVDTTLACAMVARNIGDNLAKLTAADQATILVTIQKTFREKAQLFATKLGVGGFFDGIDMDGDEAVKINRFTSRLTSLPHFSEDMTMDELDDKSYPDFGTMAVGDINCHASVTHLLPLMSQRVGFVFSVLPGRARIFALRILSILSCDSDENLMSYMEQVHPDHAVIDGQIKGFAKSSILHSENTDGGESNGHRFLRRLCTYTNLVISIFRATQAAFRITTRNDPVLAGWPGAPRELKLVHFQSASFRLTPILLKLRNNFFHLRSDGWILSDYGTKTTSPHQSKGVESSAGTTFLQNQMKNKDSIYKMPLISASEKVWEDWFNRVSDFSKTYPQLSAQLIIPVLLGHIGSQDGRILGWQESANEISAEGTQPTISQFLSYIRTLVLPTGTSRKVAAKELDQLTLKPLVVEDCLALSTKIQQLFRIIYPSQTNESEPITRLKAMISVHNMLEWIDRSKTNGPSATLSKSWKAYSAYLPTQIFLEYLDESLHKSSEDSVKLCSSYIKIVVQHLGAAHRMHIQTVRSDAAEIPKGNVPINSIQTLSSGSAQRNRTRSRNGSDNISAFAGRGRSQDQSRSDSGTDRSRSRNGRSVRGRPFSSGSGSMGRPNGSYTKRPHSDGPKLVFEGAELERRVRAGILAADQASSSASHKPGQFRKVLCPALPGLSKEVTVQKIISVACVFCQEEGHNSSKCPHFRAAGPEVRKSAIEYKRAYFDAFFNPPN